MLRRSNLVSLLILASASVAASVANGLAQGAPQEVAQRSESLTEARRGFATKLVELRHEDARLAVPPAELFTLVEYDAPSGKSAAYLSRAEPGSERLPAIVWLTGGFPAARGGGYVWAPGPFENDQSASAFRDAGVVMLFPTVRGTARNPGVQEWFCGEVDDVVAAAQFLRGLDHVDPQRVFLGGHSTGGTLALLVAESTDLFRAVFSFGPAAALADYGSRDWPFDASDPLEFRLRSPLHFLGAITSPTYVFEGEGGNAEDLAKLAAGNTNPQVRTLELKRSDHFALLAPINRHLASSILEHREGAFELDLSAVAEAYADSWHARREARDLALIAELRLAGVGWGEPRSVGFNLRSSYPERLAELADRLEPLGFDPGPVREETDEDGDPCRRMTVELSGPLEIGALLDASRAVAEAAASLHVIDEGWTLAPRAQ